jgi:C-terminal processing protease CtpA/Prc
MGVFGRGGDSASARGGVTWELPELGRRLHRRQGERDLVRDRPANGQGGLVDREATDPEKLTYAAISGMLDSLGDERHTYLMTSEETEEKPEVFSAWPVSTGLQFEDRGDEIVISALLDDSPAKEAGLSESF